MKRLGNLAVDIPIIYGGGFCLAAICQLDGGHPFMYLQVNELRLGNLLRGRQSESIRTV